MAVGNQYHAVTVDLDYFYFSKLELVCHRAAFAIDGLNMYEISR